LLSLTSVKPFILEVDASGHGIGAFIMQNGQSIAFFKSTLRPKATVASTYEKEAVVIVEALKKWKHYFASTSIIIRTDQLNLKYIHDQRLVEGIQHKLLVKLLCYNYKVEYKKGKENKVVHALSRAPHSELLALTCVIPAWIEQVTTSYTQDQKCLDLITKITVYSNSSPHFSLKIAS
jgi:hypothetical protein